MTKLNTPLHINCDNNPNDSGLMLVYDSEETLLLQVLHFKKEEHTALAELIRRANAFEELIYMIKQCKGALCAQKYTPTHYEQLHDGFIDEIKQLLTKLTEKEK